MVGRHHARIVPMEGLPPRFVLVDLRSRNGTYLNGRRIYEQAQINPGDIVQLGEGGTGTRIPLRHPAGTGGAGGAMSPAAGGLRS